LPEIPYRDYQRLFIFGWAAFFDDLPPFGGMAANEKRVKVCGDLRNCCYVYFFLSLIAITFAAAVIRGFFYLS